MLGVRAICGLGQVLFFEVLKDGLLYQMEFEDALLLEVVLYTVRVVAHIDGKWIVDPNPDNIRDQWIQLWVFEKCPMDRLEWDPIDYVWKNPKQCIDKSIPFIQYIVKVGRNILMEKRNKSKIVAASFWSSYGIPKQFIDQFWESLWNREQARKITTFHWLLVHRRCR